MPSACITHAQNVSTEEFITWSTFILFLASDHQTVSSGRLARSPVQDSYEGFQKIIQTALNRARQASLQTRWFQRCIIGGGHGNVSHPER